MTASKVIALLGCGFGGYLIGYSAGPNWYIAVAGLLVFLISSAFYDGKFDDLT